MIPYILLAILFIYVYANFTLAIFQAMFPRKVTAKLKKYPTVSAIIATLNEEATIEKCLKALRKSDYRGKMEILVVDGNSHDKTREIAKRYADNILVEKNPRGKPSALNLGVKKASGSVLFFIDADSIVEKNTIKQLVEVLDKYDAATGTINVVKETGIVPYILRVEVSCGNYSQESFFQMKDTCMLFGRNFVIKKNILKKHGGFSNVLTEDLNLSRRLYKSGHKVCFVKDAKITEQAPLKLSDYIRQHKRWIRGGLLELVKFFRESTVRDSFLMSLVITRLLIPMLFLLFVVYFIVFHSVHALTAAILSFIVFVIASRRLTIKEYIFLPFMLLFFAALEIIMPIWVELMDFLGYKPIWEKTPKHRYSNK